MANTPFKLKSGNTTSFKEMGSSPLYTHEGNKAHITEAEEKAHLALDKEMQEDNEKTREENKRKKAIRDFKKEVAN